MRVRELETRLAQAIETIGGHVERTADLESHIRLLLAGSRAITREGEELMGRVDRASEHSKRALANLLPEHRGVAATVLHECCEILRGKGK